MNDVTLITGGTGHLGRDVVRQLLPTRTVRVLARTPGTEPGIQWVQGDLAKGQGIEEAVRDVHTVIHAATLSPIARRGSIRPIDFFTTPGAVDIDGTRSLLEASQRAGVAHFLYVSIVGIDSSSLPYSRVKLAAENLVCQSPLSWSIIRAAPFYWLLERMLAKLTWLPLWLLPDTPFDAVDTGDVAAYLVECLDDGKRGMREEIGGPEVLSLADLARQFQQARGFHRPILLFHLSESGARKIGIAAASDRRGRKTWAAWLRESEAPRGDSQ